MYIYIYIYIFSVFKHFTNFTFINFYLTGNTLIAVDFTEVCIYVYIRL